MIKEFTIENYKSIQKLTINLGRVNVFIGENGCGKSNILEAFALASAASLDKLDNEFLVSRGIRVTSPELMRSAFDLEKTKTLVGISYIDNQKQQSNFELSHDNLPYSKWISESKIPKKQSDFFAQSAIQNLQSNNPSSLLQKIVDLFEDKSDPEIQIIFTKIYEKFYPAFQLKDYLIYSIENTTLRSFEKEGQIEPLGIKGEGLFKLLKYFASQPDKEILNELKSYLKLFDWFKDFSLPENSFGGESFLKIKDRFLDESLEFFDQKSANEGFLFVLFYFSLLISDKTPKFFAIDNIEASLNPKLCTKLTKCIVELSEKHQKQVLLTTHSPSILDGLDLNDPEQKLFLVYRNKLGHTVVNQVEKPKPLEGQEPIKLSEAFLRGYLGGLPKNFAL